MPHVHLALKRVGVWRRQDSPILWVINLGWGGWDGVTSRGEQLGLVLRVGISDEGVPAENLDVLLLYHS